MNYNTRVARSDMSGAGPQRQHGNVLMGAGIFVVLLIAVTLMLLSLVRSNSVPVPSESVTLLTTAIVKTNCTPAAQSLNKAIDEPGSSVPTSVMNNAYSLVENCRAKQTLRQASGTPASASPAIKTLVKHVLLPEADRDDNDSASDQGQHAK